MNLFIILLTLSFVSCIFCQSPSSCNTHKTCGACIGHIVERCVWCSENKNDITFRCEPVSHLEKESAWCNEKSIFWPSSNFTIIQNNKFSSSEINKSSFSVQFRPQEIKIKASPGVDIKFNVSYKPEKDFPLDVYFLMDYTYTMKAHREALEKQALEIYRGLKNMTKNVLLGVGSFVEKPGLPYTDTRITKNSTYAFKNHLSLTTDMKAFEMKVKGSEFGSNYDDAEAGLDALMQVMKCEDQLGWRTKTRRIIVLATDNTYHSAGDGKMLGAIKPNSETCLLKDNEYKSTDSLVYDYPSVSLINKVAREGKFLIIFAGPKKVEPIYRALSTQISGSRYSELQEKSNIFEIIKAAYQESERKVQIGQEAPPSGFRLTIDQDCESPSKRNCEVTPTSPTVTIPVIIRSTECMTPHKPEIITLNPLGLNEKLRITFEVDCECDCEKPSAVDNSTRNKCNNKGLIQCGACKCDKDWGGDMCQVSCSDENSLILEKNCYPTNSSSKCNNHGKCECGKCKCSGGFTGDVCEYDPNSCDTGNNGKICGGKDHGSCKYGRCSCEGDWTGDACDCISEEKSLKQCTGPFSKKVCSGKGRCSCGKCICDKVKGDMLSGQFCDVCKDCAIQRCQELEGYAKCNHDQRKDICDEKFNITAEINLEVLVANKTDLDHKDEWKTGTQCRTLLEDGTFLLFKYNVDTKDNEDTTSKMLLMIQKEVEVPPEAEMLLPIASAIAGILLIGLLTVVLWKVMVDLYDKREYNKFCNEASSQGYDIAQNPLYESPTQNYNNPAFNQNN